MNDQPILLVEDDSDIQENLKRVCDFEGIPLASVYNGQEALDYLQAGKPARMIILDLMMPVMNGYEFLERFRRGPHAQIPVILFSAATDIEEVAKAYGLRFLQKPINLNRLLDVIDA